MRLLIKKLKAAIKSRKEYKNELTPLQKERMKVCAGCEFNSDNKEKKTFKDNVFLSLNKVLDYIIGVKVTEEAVCLDCGCNIAFKTTQTDDELKCSLKKWK